MSSRVAALRPRNSDLLLGALAVAWGVAEDLALPGAAAQGVQLATGVIAGSAVAFRRTVPVGAAGLVVAALYVRGLADAQTNEAIMPLALLPLMFYSVARYAADAGWAIAGGAVLAALVLVPVWEELPLRQPNQFGHVFLLLLIALSWLAGWVVRRRWLESLRLRQDRESIQLARTTFVRAAAAEETLRIASTINSEVRSAASEASTHTEAASTVLDEDVEAARTQISLAGESSRAAVADLRRLLAVLRTEGQQSTAAAAAHGERRRKARWPAIMPAVAVAVVSVAEVLLVTAPGSTAGRLGGAVAVALPLIWCARFPVSAAVATAVTVVARAALDQYGEIGISAIAASAVAAAAAGRFASRRGAVLATGLLVVAVSVASALQDGNLNDLVMLSVLVVLATVAASAIGRRSEDLEQSTLQYARACDERELLVREALDELRRGIARETHDSVGYALASLNMHAEAALLVLDSDQVAARGHIDSMQAAARLTHTELDRLVHGLEHVTREELDSGPGVESIPALVRGSGLSARTSIDCPTLPLRIASTAYRVVQESILNVQKHAPDSDVTVDLSAESGSLRVAIVNGRPAGPPVELPGGHGLIGMRERVTAIRGSLIAGPTDDGGWSTVAILPLDAETPMPAVRDAARGGSGGGQAEG